MQAREIVVANRQGLHARACARIVHVASKFSSNVLLSSGARRASANSIVAVMLLAAAFGATIRIETSGPDEMAAMTAIVDLIHGDLDTRI
jgi:phosphocarrier protein HPr